MFNAIKLIVFLIILVLIGAGLWYGMNLKADLAVSEMNNKALQDGIKEQQDLLDSMKKDVESIQKANAELQKENEKTKADVNTLTGKFDKRDFGSFAHQKPEVVEKLVNRGTENAMRCLELASGAPLNEKEKNAKTPTEANRECPALINPNYSSPN